MKLMLIFSSEPEILMPGSSFYYKQLGITGIFPVALADLLKKFQLVP
jgi:hypothetical protein